MYIVAPILYSSSFPVTFDKYFFAKYLSHKKNRHETWRFNQFHVVSINYIYSYNMHLTELLLIF